MLLVIIPLANGLISALSIFFILNIFWFYHKKQTSGEISGEKDYGLIWLAVGFLCWTLTGLIDSAYPADAHPNSEYLIIFLSIINNGIFICSFTFFDHGIDSLNKKIEKRQYFAITAAVTLILIAVIFLLMGTENSTLLMTAKYLELIYSGITLTMFAGILFNSFFIRKLYGIAFAAILVIFLLLFIQMAEVLDDLITARYHGFIGSIYIASHSLLLTIVISLSFSWVIEKIEETHDADLNIKGKKVVDKYGHNTVRLKEFLLNQFAENQIKFVFLVLMEYYKRNPNHNKQKTIILNFSTFSRIEDELRNGLITQSEYNNELNIIKNTLIDLINDIK